MGLTARARAGTDFATRLVAGRVRRLPPPHHLLWRRGPQAVKRRCMLAVAALTLGMPGIGRAYTAAGDRTFSANLLLPQIAPSDAFGAR